MKAIVSIVIMSIIAGCGLPSSQDNLQPLVAVTGNYGVWSAAVGPTPAPTPSKVCSSCNGRKVVGDGRVMVKCAACDGTGVSTEECETCRTQPTDR